jgi:hypothetical protein
MPDFTVFSYVVNPYHLNPFNVKQLREYEPKRGKKRGKLRGKKEPVFWRVGGRGRKYNRGNMRRLYLRRTGYIPAGAGLWIFPNSNSVGITRNRTKTGLESLYVTNVDRSVVY